MRARGLALNHGVQEPMREANPTKITTSQIRFLFMVETEQRTPEYLKAR